MNKIITPPGGAGSPPPTQINLDASQLDDVHCEQCGSMVFVQAYVIKKIPAMVAPSGRDSFAPISIFRCALCGHINEAFLAGAGGTPAESPPDAEEENMESTDLSKITPLKPEKSEE
jgi:hypothetical protein